jgi:uncharacterized protein YndB with AHSA1/START domain
MDDQPLGAVVRDGGRVGLRFERTFPHPPAKVWRALTESEHLRAWMPCDIVGERRAGASIELPFWPPLIAKYDLDTPVLTGRIVVWDPPHTFEWTWDIDVLRWELSPTPEGTALTFTTWLGQGEDGLTNTAAGYHVCLGELAVLLDTGHAPGVHEADPTPLEQRYEQAMG